MKAFRWAILTVCVAASATGLGGCGDGDDFDGNEPSGSIIDVVGVTPNPAEAFTPDLVVNECSDLDANGNPTLESGLTNNYANVEMVNNSRPTTPQGQSTNSYVTMSRYRVDFTGVSMSVNIPPVSEGGMTVGLPPGGSSTMSVLVMDLPTLQFIRVNYPSAVSRPLTLRANITIWGKDAFGADISTTAQATLVVTNYDRCSTSGS